MSRVYGNNRIGNSRSLAERDRNIGPLNLRRGVEVRPVRRRRLATAVVTAAIRRTQFRLLGLVVMMHRLARTAGVRRGSRNRHPYRCEYTHQQQSQQKSGSPAMHREFGRTTPLCVLRRMGSA